jgi:hypothetical protein
LGVVLWDRCDGDGDCHWWARRAGISTVANRWLDLCARHNTDTILGRGAREHLAYMQDMRRWPFTFLINIDDPAHLLFPFFCLIIFDDHDGYGFHFMNIKRARRMGLSKGEAWHQNGTHSGVLLILEPYSIAISERASVRPFFVSAFALSLILRHMERIIFELS